MAHTDADEGPLLVAPPCLAVDFDETLSRIHCMDHTTLDALLRNKNERVCKFVTAAMDLGSKVGVATYNDRVEKIDAFCQEVFGKRLPIAGGLPTRIDAGKEEHIAKLFPGAKPNDVMLVDDNWGNISIAKAAGHKTYKVDPFE